VNGFGVEFWGSSLREVVEYAVRAEEAGFNRVWVPDLTTWGGELWVTLAAIAAKTSEIGLGTEVTNPFIRNPIVTAYSAASLDQLSNGRMVLGFGKGAPKTLKQFNIRIDDPLLAIAECLAIVKRLMCGETVSCEGKLFRVSEVKLPVKPVQEHMPLFVASSDVETLRFAGENADGAIVGACSRRHLEFKKLGNSQTKSTQNRPQTTKMFRGT
jgi:5,10-methylenetetrahydromethanopterin reductase